VSQLSDNRDESPADDLEEQIEERLDQLADASSRVGRRDWVTALLGVLSGGAISAVSLITTPESEILAVSGVLVAGIVAFWSQRLRPSSTPHPPSDPDSRIRQRADAIGKALEDSVSSLDAATRLISDLQHELNDRMTALDKLRQDIADNEERAKISAEAAQALDRLITTEMRGQDKRNRQWGWVQVLAGTVLGGAVTVAVVVFGHFLPLVK
jgi:signal transduction histidine kinase